MTLAELGAQLRDERLRLNIALEDAASRLKIATRILRALENGDESELPHMVYTKGFIRSYGALLGLVPEEVTALLNSLDGAQPQVQEPRTPVDIPARRSGRALGFLLKLLLLSALGSGGYYYYVHNYRDAGPETASWEESSGIGSWFSSSPDESPQAKAQEQENLAEAGVMAAAEAGVALPGLPIEAAQLSPAEPATLQAPATTNGNGNSNGNGNTAAPDPAAQALVTEATPAPVAPLPVAPSALPGPGLTSSSQAAMNVSQAEAQAPTPGNPLEAAAEQALQTQDNPQPQLLPDGQHQVVVTADAECWLHANADGTVNREFSLKKGETFAMPFKTSMVLRLGNAGGVKIKYDGIEQPSPGKSGEVKTVHFPPQS